jgi:hypothetical protein
MNYWWVNQGRTYKHEIPGGYMWSPKLDKLSRHRAAYDSMLLAEPGDCVFSYFGGSIKAVGVVMNRARSCPRPDFEFANQYWNEDGWLVNVEFQELSDTFDPKSMLSEYLLLGPAFYGPINKQGRVNMEYLYSIPENLGSLYKSACHVDLHEIAAEGLAERDLELSDNRVDDEDSRLRTRTDIGPTEIRALSLARRGQGFFKKEVAHIEKNCRLTGITEQRHLRASHIKPWSQSNDSERLDGSNGLLLSPHVDHLFDRGYLSFKRNGVILQSPSLKPEVADKWQLDLGMNVGEFTRRQEGFLEYHRDSIFKK